MADPLKRVERGARFNDEFERAVGEFGAILKSDFKKIGAVDEEFLKFFVGEEIVVSDLERLEIAQA